MPSLDGVVPFGKRALFRDRRLSRSACPCFGVGCGVMDSCASGADVAMWLDSLPNGKGCSLFCDDVDEGLLALGEATTRPASPATAVTLRWTRLPRLSVELGQAADALSSAVVTLYPALYASAAQRQVEDRSSTTGHDLVTASRRIPGVLANAVRRIVAACRAHKAPQLRDLPLADQLRQLALALDPTQLVLQLAIGAQEWPETTLLSFARGAEWLATNTGAKVVLVLPARLSGHSDLDSVTYRSLRLRGDGTSTHLQTAAQKPNGTPDAKPDRDPDSDRTAPEVFVSPTIGKPHPASEAEQRLHGRITSDPELGPLFQYNQLVTMESGNTPRVDLLWPEGRLVVEVDGYPFHARRCQFHSDRERDFRLLMSGYHVWRIDDAEIVTDAERVVEKLRQLVRMIRKESP